MTAINTAIEVSDDQNEVRTLEKCLEIHKPKNRRSDEDKRAILAQIGSAQGMTVSAVAWINKVPVNYLYRWQTQLAKNTVVRTGDHESAE